MRFLCIEPYPDKDIEDVSMSAHHHDSDHTEPPSDLVLRVQALESLLVDKGLVDLKWLYSTGHFDTS